MEISDSVKSGLKTTLDSFETLNEVNEFVDTMDEEVREELADKIEDRRRELDDSPTLQTSTNAELLAHIKDNQERRSQVVDALSDESSDTTPTDIANQLKEDESALQTAVQTLIEDGFGDNLVDILQQEGVIEDLKQTDSQKEDTSGQKVDTNQPLKWTLADGAKVYGRVTDTAAEDNTMWTVFHQDDGEWTETDIKVEYNENSVELLDHLPDQDEVSTLDPEETAERLADDTRAEEDQKALRRTLRDIAERLGLEVEDEASATTIAAQIEANTDREGSAPVEDERVSARDQVEALLHG